MKTYPSDTTQVINATARAPERIIIPPFSYLGAVTATLSEKWYPPTAFYLTGGYATANSAGTVELPLLILRDRQRVAVEPVGTTTSTLLASATLEEPGVKAVFTLENDIGHIVVNPGQWIQVATMADSGHVGLVVQLFGNKV